MLKFQVFDAGQPVTRWPLRNAYLIGADGSAMRGTVRVDSDGLIVAEKHESGSAALALQHHVGNLGELTLQTCLLPEREEPYLLTLELARHRLMVLYTKLEDWGMFELEEDHPVTRRANAARDLFIQALCVQREDGPRSAELAQQALVASLDGSEELALAHAELLLNRRKSTGAMPKLPIGVGVCLDHQSDRLRSAIQATADFIQLPLTWRRLAPEEQGYNWAKTDAWAQWAAANRVPVVAGPLLSLEPGHPPDWLYIWEHDYDTVRDLIYEHIERVVSRYKGGVAMWNVASGLHVNKHFTFNFEQLMDLTRMATMLVKKLAPQVKALIEVRQPFGEYYSTNARSIPPLMYADLVTQSAIAFDGFAVRLNMGQAQPGQYTRDLMQISNLLDTFAPFAKPIYLTIAAPSEPVTPMMIASAESNDPVDAESGYWRRPWSQQVQAHWLEAVLQVAMSKPFVETVAWQDFVDHPDIDLPLGGLVSEEMQPKAGLRRLAGFRQNMLGLPARKAATAGTAAAKPEASPAGAAGRTDDAGPGR